MSDAVQVYKPRHNVRVVTATSLFDGHDAAINIFRRLLQSTGVEVIHLGHNRSVKEIVDAAIEEDAQGKEMDFSTVTGDTVDFNALSCDNKRLVGRAITVIEQAKAAGENTLPFRNCRHHSGLPQAYKKTGGGHP